jgi:hypothetical protein
MSGIIRVKLKVLIFAAIHMLDDVSGRNFMWNLMRSVSDYTVIHTRCVKYIAA